MELVDAGRPRDLREAAAALAECEGRIDELPPERREQARFFVAVRKADLWFRSPDPEVRSRVVPLLVEARARAKKAGVYRGSYRVLLHVLAWQADRGWLARLDDEEREFLLQEDLFEDELARASYLHAPARLLRFELVQGTDREAAELRALHTLELELAAAPDQQPWHAKCLDALALYYAGRRDFARARIYVDRLGDEAGRLARALLALQRGDHRTAEALARKVVGEGDEQGLPVLGDALEAQGRYEEGLAAYERFLAGRREPDNRAAALNGRGDCLLGLGRLDEAEESYRQVLQISAGTLGLRAEIAETEKDLGRLAEARGRAVEAFEHYRRSLDLLARLRSGLSTDAFGGTFYAAHPDQLTAVDGLLRVAAAAGADPWDVLAATEKLKAASALDAVRSGYSAGDRKAVREAMDRLASVRDPAGLQQVLLELGVLRAGLARQPRRPAAPLDAGGLRRFAKARPGTLILSYWIGRRQSWVLWSEGGQAPRSLLLGDTAAALRWTGEAYRAVLDPGADTGALAGASAFFLPADLGEALGRAGDLLVSADTEIARLPFEALRAGVGGEPVGCLLPVERAPSLSVAQALHERQPATGPPVLVYAASDPELENVLGLPPLASSEREAELVARALPGARRLRKKAASLAGLQQALAVAPSVLHLSAHAVDLPLAPSCSLLVLSDGAVSMASLSALPLAGSLIVLSSCDSAVGELRGQEGVVGLVEGAFAAGARSVVASRFRVNQQATADLMGQFYYHLQQGLSPAAAMQRARRTLWQSEQYRHPHYWAGFSVYGGSAASRPDLPARLWLGSALAALVILGLGLRAYRRRRVSTSASGRSS